MTIHIGKSETKMTLCGKSVARRWWGRSRAQAAQRWSWQPPRLSGREARWRELQDMPEGGEARTANWERDREKVPLMKELHELGLKHRVQMVVVAIPMQGNTEGVQALLIDHNNATPLEDVAKRFIGAGVYLIQSASAVEEPR